MWKWKFAQSHSQEIQEEETSHEIKFTLYQATAYLQSDLKTALFTKSLNTEEEESVLAFFDILSEFYIKD